jgi:hypothetical protein
MQSRGNLVLIIMSGIPCSGKDHWINSMEEKLYNEHGEAPVITICRNRIRDAKYGKTYIFSKEREEAITKEFYKQLGIASTFKKAVIILNSTHCTEYSIDRYTTVFRGMLKSGEMSMFVKFVDVPFWKAQLRNIWRGLTTGYKIPFGAMKSFNKTYNKIDRTRYKSFN